MTEAGFSQTGPMQSGMEYPSFTVPRLKQEISHGLTLTVALVAGGIQIFQGFVALLYLMHKSGRCKHLPGHLTAFFNTHFQLQPTYILVAPGLHLP